MKVKIKKLREDAVIPAYAKDGDAGMDMVAVTREWEGGLLTDIVTYGTGLSLEIPKGYVGLLFPRSSVYKTGMLLCNSVGVLDSGYRGEVMFKYTLHGNKRVPYDLGDKVGQIVIIPYPQIEFEEVKELSETERGEGGFGSTDVERREWASDIVEIASLHKKGFNAGQADLDKMMVSKKDE